MKHEHDLVILTSGGYDSTLLLHLAKLTGFTPIALLIDYGQKHIRELESAQRLCDLMEVPYRKMTVSLTGVESGFPPRSWQEFYLCWSCCFSCRAGWRPKDLVRRELF
jgi:tRNA(Ile)-lysidine synthase TilS/MesJ